MKSKTNRRSSKISLPKICDRKLIRLNLMLAAMYILAYEVLYECIVGGTKILFGVEHPPDTNHDVEPNQLHTLPAEIPPSITKELQNQRQQIQDGWKTKNQRFQEEVGIDPLHPSTTKLLRECSRWLFKQGVLSESDLENIEQVIKHRHEVAHEIPYFVIGKDLDIDLRTFKLIPPLVSKVDLVWFRLASVDSLRVSEEEFKSSRSIILEQIIAAVDEYLPHDMALPRRQVT